jgi:thiamine pyrophosphokinase
VSHEFEQPPHPNGESGAARVAIVVTGGAPLLARSLDGLPRDAFVIAADAGLDHALAVGLIPDLVVGDLDSVQASGIAWAREHGVPIEVYPTDKDLTDTQIALGAAWRRQVDRIIVLSGGGDRLDHTISAITALGHPSLADHAIEARWGPAGVHVLHGPGYWELDVGAAATFTLLALHGPCSRVTLSGARWPLQDATIEPGSTLGTSNVSTDTIIRVSVGAGVLTVLIPHQFGEPQ